MPFWRRRSACARPAESSARLDPATLLSRRPVSLDTPELQRFLAGKRVMVTGAGGSIGSEIARQTMRFCPERLILVERAEGALFEIDRELRETWTGAEISPAVCDVTDRARVAAVLAEHRPHILFHAAAHKHVPMMESHPGEAIKNNALGTRTLADAAVAAGVPRFVMVSTDKAVNPSSVMGATKRFAELYLQWLNGRQEATRFVAVRFGNVLGSSGSVVPIFQRQIDAGGPVTVTHPDMRRYFMTIPEASQLVMLAGTLGKGGEIFVLDMGEPVRILDLAENLIRRRGLKPGKDIRIVFTGIRPGEKLDEQLATDGEDTLPTAHPRIRVWQIPCPSSEEVESGLAVLKAAVDAPPGMAVSALASAVPEYRPMRQVQPLSADAEEAAEGAAPRLRLVSDSDARAA